MSWNKARILGFPLEVHASALVIFGLVVLMGIGAGPGGAARSVVVAAVLVVSILVHELGHALVARAMGLGPCAILLHGFGGLTRMGKPPGHGQGIVVSLAGPVAGLALGAVALGAQFLVASPLHGLVGVALSTLLLINIFWSIFNLLPMYPLDGGHVLWHGSALIAGPRLGRVITRWVSLAIAAAVGVAGVVYGQIFIVFIALFAARHNLSSA